MTMQQLLQGVNVFLVGMMGTGKTTVGQNLAQDRERLSFIRSIIGYESKLMVDCNQIWGVDEAIKYMKKLKEFKVLDSKFHFRYLVYRYKYNIYPKLKKKFKKLLTIIIPRHINRINAIKTELNNLNLKVHLDEPKKKIDPNTDIYLVNSYGKTRSFYNNTNSIFLGGSLINHGGQNPLEAARYGCKILHGPNVSNFKEIYEFLKKKNVTNKIIDQKQLASVLNKTLKKKNVSKKIIQNLHFVGVDILNKTYKEICK